MIIKIISSGETGAERAALDVAIKLGIRHGGYICKGCPTEEGALPDKYRLTEIESTNRLVAAEKSLTLSDGTLVIYRGKLAAHPHHVFLLAQKRQIPVFQVNLLTQSAFTTSRQIAEWIKSNNISILNVSGPSENQDGAIYDQVMGIMEAVFFLDLMDADMPKTVHGPRHSETSPSSPFDPPASLGSAIEHLINNLPLKDRAMIANMAEVELPTLHFTLGNYIHTKFRLNQGNTDLIQSCRGHMNMITLEVEDIPAVIIRSLWQQLQKTHKLRCIK
ncbi:MAG: hypothetical protein HKM93_04370 [Desulfobacteraceae bacterium]|nr:hypothetical protein [Desulfobacteraceae bacterium]